MDQANNPGTERLLRYAVCVLCLSVVLLTLHAKLSLYDDLLLPPSSVNHSGALLSADQKMEVRTVAFVLPVLCFAIIVLPLLLQARTVVSSAAVLEVAVARPLNGFEPSLFSRPPPAL